MGLATEPRIQRASDAVRTRTPQWSQPSALIARYRWHLLIPALYCLITAILLWPLVQHARSAVADTLADPLLNAWTLRWVQHALITNPLHLYDGNMFAPNPRTLAFSEALLPQALMAWPIWLLTHDSLLAYNLSVLVTYPLCALAMYALCRALGANRGGAFIAGLLYAFAPFRMDNTAHLQVLSMQWMPLAILAVIRYFQASPVQRPVLDSDRPPDRRPIVTRAQLWCAVGVTITVTLFALSSVYYAIMFGTGFVVFLLIEAIRQRRQFISRSILGLLIALAVAGGIVGLLDRPYLIMRDEQGITRTLDEAYDDSAHSDTYLTVTPGSLMWNHLLPTSGVERSALFPGALLILLALAGLRAVRRRWIGGIVALGMTGFVLSFGPTWGAKGAGIPLPYRVLFNHIVGYKGLRGPDRFATLVLLALAVLAALGATWLWDAAITRRPAIKRYAMACAAVVALLGIGDVATRLLPTVPVDQSAATLAPYQWLAAHPETGTVAEFPVERMDQTAAFYSTLHWRPVLWGHSGFIPAATYHLRGVFASRKDYPTDQYIDALADIGVRTVLIHRNFYSQQDLTDIDRTLAANASSLQLEARAGDTDIYRIMPNRNTVPLVIDATFAINPTGNFGHVNGTINIVNSGQRARMLYTIGKFDVEAVVQDASGKQVSRVPLAAQPPAVIQTGTTRIGFDVALPAKPGEYTLSLISQDVPSLQAQASVPVRVVDDRTLPNLTLVGQHVTAPPLFTPDEPIAMWVTDKSGRTTPLPDTTATAEGALDVTLPPISGDAAQIVAHGKTSGLELWVARP